MATNCPNSVGIVPARRLLLRSRSVRLVNLPILIGIVPVKRLERNSSAVKFVSSPSSVGMLPMADLVKLSAFSFVNRCKQVGMRCAEPL